MNAKGWMLLALIVALIAAVAAFVYLAQDSAPVATTPEEELTPSLAGSAIYASGEYGFTLVYPESARLEEAFSPEYHLAQTWRATAPLDSDGTPVLSLVAYETKSESTYPRYYRALVRLGVSGETNGCEQTTPNEGETPLPDVVINGTTWKAFSFEDAGMQQYVKGVSYRVVHDEKCFALEKIAAGSSYREDAPSATDVSEEALEAQYAALDSIVASFSFTHP